MPLPAFLLRVAEACKRLARVRVRVRVRVKSCGGGRQAVLERREM